MNETIETYIYLRNRERIDEEIINRNLLVLKLKNGATVRIPMSRKLRKALIR